MKSSSALLCRRSNGCVTCERCSLDLDAWINEPPSESESEDEKPRTMFTREETKHSRPRHTEVDEKELAKVRRARSSSRLRGHTHGGSTACTWQGTGAVG